MSIRHLIFGFPLGRIKQGHYRIFVLVIFDFYRENSNLIERQMHEDPLGIK